MRLSAALAIWGVMGVLVACQRSAPGVASSVGFGSAAAPTQTPTTGGGDWPRFLGPSANNVSPEKGINKDWTNRPPKPLWKVDLSDNGYAGPAVAGGKVFIIDHAGSRDVVRALDLKTGADVWTFAYEDTASANYGYARSTPAISAGKVYTISRLGLVHCLDAATGKLVWSRDVAKDFGTKRPGWDLAGSPVLDGNRLVLAPGGQNAAIVVLNKDTGQTVLQGGGDVVTGYATPVIATINGVKQYVIFTAKSVRGVSATDGQVLWSVPWETSYDVNAPTPIVIGNSVFVTSGYGKGCALIDVKADGASIRWQSRDLVSRFNTPVYWQNKIYGIGEPGNMVCLDPMTGQLHWKQSGFEWGGLVLVDGVLIALDGRTGACVMVRAVPESYQEMGRFTPLGGQSWTAPVIAQGRLIVRNTKAIACFDLR